MPLQTRSPRGDAWRSCRSPVSVTDREVNGLACRRDVAELVSTTPHGARRAWRSASARTGPSISHRIRMMPGDRKDQ